jgi:uncharacterized sporulation protein YeaH/YhbH (DUF444 family)
MSHSIIDRRLNPSGKNLGNRQRFLKRAKEQLRKSVKDGLLDRSITSSDDQDVNVPVSDGTHEPTFRHNHKTGNKDFVLPGNKEFVPGDLIEKPQGGEGSGGKQGSPDGEGEDSFTFPISKDEFNDILFEGLELPNLKKKTQKESVSFTKTRAGFVNDGTPANLDLLRSMKNSIGRRIALKRPKLRRIREIKELLEELYAVKNPTAKQKTEIEELEKELATLRRKSGNIPFLDPIDLRYRNYENVPKPKHKAVMFCVMDVSASMGEHEKDLAKRFYLLLYLFLEYKYDQVDVVFIRHHSRATECTEEEFFHSRESGGTVVSSGFELMYKIQKERYDENEWNIYCAQASDGDNFMNDNQPLTQILDKTILPMCQFFAYIEVNGMNEMRGMWYGGQEFGIWPIYKSLKAHHSNLATAQVDQPEEVYGVFRELFKKEDA